MHKESLTIGIIGGMGPAATVDLFGKIVSKTPARRDQDHIRVLVDSNPKIPDRTNALFNGGPDPVPAMLESAVALQKAGADFLVVPCNTAHVFVERFKHELQVPFLSMIESTAEYVRKNYPDVKKVGLLGTDGTIKAGVYKDIFAGYGMKIISPSEDTQKQCVMESIYGEEGIKAGFTEVPRVRLASAANEMVAAGAEVILMACTEIPLAMCKEDVEAPLLDPTAILAEAAVKKALQKNDC